MLVFLTLQMVQDHFSTTTSSSSSPTPPLCICALLLTLSLRALWKALLKTDACVINVMYTLK